MIPQLPALVWAALSLGGLALVTLFVLGATDLSEAIDQRAWLQVAVFGLAALAALGLVLLAAIRFDVLQLP